MWADKAAADPPTTVTSPTAFLVDFLPVIRRRLTRTGLVIEHVHYYSDALKPLIARRDQLDRLAIRCDPRDLSRVWVLDPDSRAYLPVGYRNLARPAISLWEHRAAVARLRESGRGEVDEQALFATVERMRDVADSATRSTRRARRERARRPIVSAPPAADAPRTPPAAAQPPTAGIAAVPFSDIEQW